MRTLIKYLVILNSIGLSYAWSQQPSPVGILFNPRVNTFAISGVGGGNLYEFSAAQNSTSGQMAIDLNAGLRNTKTKRSRKEKLQTLTTIFKYNPFLNTNYISGDSIETRKLAFVDNEFQMMFGFRLSNLKTIGVDNDSRLLNSLFLDVSTAPYSLKNSADQLNTGFRSFNTNLGCQFGYFTNYEIGIFGVIISPQINHIYIYENNPNGTTFEELNKSKDKLSNNFLGWGLKFSVPMNDFCIFFETRKYIPLGNANKIYGLTDRAIFSIGGIATGTVFKTKTKETKYND